jgi:hypothetical protein
MDVIGMVQEKNYLIRQSDYWLNMRGGKGLFTQIGKLLNHSPLLLSCLICFVS